MAKNFGKSCFFFCKDTNFLANHNNDAYSDWVTGCCFFFCKDTNFLANHNICLFVLAFVQLFLLLQRY